VEQDIPGIEGIDTRQLTKIIREKGSMLGKIVIGDANPESVATVDPASLNLVKEVSIKVS
jgi:carbamoylphosphate synthase small subunit